MLSYSWIVWLTLLTSLLFIQSPPFKASMWTHFIYLKRIVNTTFLSPDIIFTGKLPEFQLIEKKHMRWRFISLIPSLLLSFSLRWRQAIMNDRLMAIQKVIAQNMYYRLPIFSTKINFPLCIYTKLFAQISRYFCIPPKRASEICLPVYRRLLCKVRCDKRERVSQRKHEKCSIEIHRPWRNIHNKMELTSQRLLINTIFMRKRLERFLPLTIYFSQKYSLIRTKIREWSEFKCTGSRGRAFD